MARALAAAAAVLLAGSPAFSAAAGPQREEFTRTFQRSVTLEPGKAVRIEHRHGDVTIRAHGGREVRIDASIRVSAATQADAQAFGGQIQIQVEQGAAALEIRTVYPERRDNSFLGFGRRSISYSVNYEIVVPEAAPLAVRNSFGNVTVTNHKGGAEITNAHGLLTFRDGAGVQRLSNQFGGVEVSENAGDVTVTNANSFVSATGIKGALSVTNRFGAVKALRIAKTATIVNGNGAVELSGAAGPSRVTSEAKVRLDRAAIERRRRFRQPAANVSSRG